MRGGLPCQAPSTLAPSHCFRDWEGEGHGGSSVTGDCHVGEIREGFLEEVILELGSEDQAGKSRVQRENLPILRMLLILCGPSCLLREVFLALSPRLGSHTVAVYLYLSLSPLQTGSCHRTGPGLAPLCPQHHLPGHRNHRGAG